MKEFKVLGSGCSKCVTTARLIEEISREKGIEVKVEKVTDLAQIVGYGLMSTPGVVVDGKVMHAGGIPARARIEEWLSA